MSQEHGVATPITRYHKGDLILREGDAGTHIYKILSGSVELFTAYETAQAQRLTSLSYPSCFGETAMLSGQPHPYTAIACEGTTLMRVSEAGFESFLKNDHQNALHIMKAQAQKLVAMHGLLHQSQNPGGMAAEAGGLADADPEQELAHLTAQAQEAVRRAEEAQAEARRALRAQKAAEEKEAARKTAQALAAAKRAAQAHAARQAAQEQAERMAAEAQAAAEAAARARAAADEAAWKTAQAQAAAEFAALAQKEAQEAALMELQAEQAARTAQVQAGVQILPEEAPQAAPRESAPGLYLPGHKGYPGITHPEYKKYIFEKKLSCPHCKGSLTGQRILHSKLIAAPGAGRGRYDLRGAYKGFQTEWYALVTCPHCYFTTGYNAFTEPKGLKKERYAAQLQALAPAIHMDFKAERDLDFVFTQHYLALVCTRGFSDAGLKSAQLWMDLNWLYEDAGDEAMREQAQNRALEGFKEAYSKIRLSPVQEQRICMMIAAMEYRAGNMTEARDWAFKVRMNRAGKESYIKLAEDLIDDIRSIKKAEG